MHKNTHRHTQGESYTRISSLNQAINGWIQSGIADKMMMMMSGFVERVVKILRRVIDQPNRWAFRCQANVRGERVADLSDMIMLGVRPNNDYSPTHGRENKI